MHLFEPLLSVCVEKLPKGRNLSYLRTLQKLSSKFKPSRLARLPWMEHHWRRLKIAVSTHLEQAEAFWVIVRGYWYSFHLSQDVYLAFAIYFGYSSRQLTLLFYQAFAWPLTSVLNLLMLYLTIHPKSIHPSIHPFIYLAILCCSSYTFRVVSLAKDRSKLGAFANAAAIAFSTLHRSLDKTKLDLACTVCVWSNRIHDN